MSHATDLEKAAVALASTLGAGADDAEKARRIPADLSKRFADAGFYRMFVPANVGGLEASPLVGARVFETLARADASSAWVAFIGATSGSVLSQVSEQAAREIFADRNALICGVFAPSGRAERQRDGFTVTGRWQWGSGSQNAAWLLGGCSFYEDGGPMTSPAGKPRQHMVIFPAARAEILDTWHVSGLRGTGSTDFRVEALVVPERHVVGYPDAPVATRPLYRFPHFAFLAFGIASVALGIARAAIDDLVAIAATKKRFGTGSTLAAKAHSHLTLATAEAKVRAARALFYEALEAAWAASNVGDSISVDLRRDLRLATTHAVGEATSAVDAMYTLAGGSSVYESSTLQRRFRDIHAVTQHIMVAPGSLETVGRLLFGVETDTSAL